MLGGLSRRLFFRKVGKGVAIAAVAPLVANAGVNPSAAIAPAIAPALGNGYLGGQARIMSDAMGHIVAITITHGGAGYSTPPIITILDGSGP